MVANDPIDNADGGKSQGAPDNPFRHDWKLDVSIRRREDETEADERYNKDHHQMQTPGKPEDLDFVLFCHYYHLQDIEIIGFFARFTAVRYRDDREIGETGFDTRTDQLVIREDIRTPPMERGRIRLARLADEIDLLLDIVDPVQLVLKCIV
jgi:hypothetical protein